MIGVEILKAELQLIVIEPLGAPAELAALQLLDDEIEPLDLGLRLGRGWCARPRAQRTIRCSVSTSSGRAARSMFMRAESS